jgi:hypothetical protein
MKKIRNDRTTLLHRIPRQSHACRIAPSRFGMEHPQFTDRRKKWLYVQGV